MKSMSMEVIQKVLEKFQTRNEFLPKHQYFLKPYLLQFQYPHQC